MAEDVLALPVHPDAEANERAAVEALRTAGQAVVRMIEAMRVEGYTSTVLDGLESLRFVRNIQGIITLHREPTTPTAGEPDDDAERVGNDPDVPTGTTDQF